MRRYAIPIASVLLLPATSFAQGITGADALLAQASPTRPAAPATSSTSEMKKYLVFFDWNKSVLTPEAKKIIANAADDFKKTGSARIVATGHTDTSGSAVYNMGLSVRRADAVKAELVRLGVPAGNIVTIGKGQTDLLVPTKDGVREAQNRRVSIEMPVAVAAKPAPAPAPTPVVAPPPPPPPPLKWAATLGPWVGWNLRESDPGNPTKQSLLVGPEVSIKYAITPNWVADVAGAGFNTVGTSQNDGWGGRGVAGIRHQWNLGAWHPSIGPEVGYIFGKGTQDGVVLGPVVGLDVDLTKNMFLYSKVGYDHNFRNEITQGIVNGGLGMGYRW